MGSIVAHGGTVRLFVCCCALKDWAAVFSKILPGVSVWAGTGFIGDAYRSGDVLTDGYSYAVDEWVEYSDGEKTSNAEGPPMGVMTITK